MRNRFFALAVVLGCVLVAAPLFAQNPTGTINGHVSYEGDALPGVTVTVASPALQGQRTAITSANGDYTFKFLTPGEYKVTFQLDSFRALEQTVKVSVAQAKRVDAVMYPEAVTEEIVVTSNYETISSTTQAATTYEQELIEDLPVARTMASAVLLSPGTTSNGPRDAIVISGAQSHENLFLINGVAVMDNIRYTPSALYIEDAVEETTTLTSGVSAEYGRFAGGVVNMITKSGGNEFSGSYRLNLTNDDWIADTPVTTAKEDTVNKVHEATLGGYIMKDKLWFFLAGRDRAITGSSQFYNQVAFPTTEDETRYEYKLTFSPHASHRILGSYIEREVVQTNDEFWANTAEPSAIDPERSLPYDLMAFNYTGVVTESFFLEGQYSEKTMAFSGSGGTAAPGDRINGTAMIMWPEYSLAGSMLFCGECGDEERNNENFLLKGSYFLSSESLGTHDIVFGYDSFTDIRLSNNYQSPSNFVMYNYNAQEEINPVTGGLMSMYGDDGIFYPAFTGNSYFGTYGYREDMDYWPIFISSIGTDFVTDSMYINDTWRVNNKMTATIGFRYDSNDGKDAAGVPVADDKRISPRLGMTYDVKGDGEWLINASYARYVTALANGVADSAGGGNPSWIGYSYYGPSINFDENGVYTHEYTTPEAMAIVFGWFDAVGGLANTGLWYGAPSISGGNLLVEGLDSPYTDEFSVGVTKRFGNKGLVRADFVHREAHDFYMEFRNLSTGTIDVTANLTEDIVLSDTFDLGYVVNDDNIYRREYDGLHTQFQYRLNDRLSFGGNWTWSHLRGNFVGETSGSGPVTGNALNYPEYTEEAWNYPTGSLSGDQRHKVRAFAVWDAISTSRHNLTVSLLQNFWSGTPYGASGSVDVDWLANPGYLTPSDTATYWFENRDTYHTDDITRTDIALNYSFFVNLFGAEVEMFVQPEVLNLFNEDGAVSVNNSISVDKANFNPFTDEPVEGVHWDKGTNFGQPTGEGDFQAPRTFRVSMGLRF